MSKALFITGTGTDVGKTALSLAILMWAQNQGLRCAYYKPIQCGTFPFGNPPTLYGDATWVEKMLGGKITTQVTYKLELAASPHLAAEQEGIFINMEFLEEEASRLIKSHDLVIMEGAGGAAVPFNRQGTTLTDLSAQLSLPCLIATYPGLGTLHHTLTTVEYLKSKKIKPIGFVFCHIKENKENKSDLCEDNRRTLTEISKTPCWGELPFHLDLASQNSFSLQNKKAWISELAPNLSKWWITP